ncbi:hypothetical protein R3P38DRAFT_3074680 [Favolaschia claudopus]|uniref:Ketoreductase (KR) domain-containing protein n=1 Tax=Favolaschia claudopus TaxID=2862362 RepID=A0AAV9ZXT3_9AGAR
MANRPGVASALAGSGSRTALSLFSLPDRVALVTGGNRGIGLEMALVLAEAGAIVYCLDLPTAPDEEWLKVKAFVDELPAIENQQKKAKLEYISGDVTDQKAMWGIVEKIVEKEGRIDVLDVNVSGVLFTAQAAGRQMERLGIQGSIILTASMSGTIVNPGGHWIAYNTSKSAVLQMARSLACALARKEFAMTRGFLDKEPGLQEKLSAQNPMGRFGRPDELRGVTLWLASDASTFCTGADIKVDGGQCAW